MTPERGQHVDRADSAAQASAGAPLTGRRLGVFEVERVLGVGGMGEVYRARDTRLGRSVALKIVPPVFKDDPGRCARFEREARVLASLNHPHIAAIHGVEESDDVTALVMELVEGDDLSHRRPSSVADALTIARQIAEAIEAAHERGVIHRDLKPANIKVRPDGVVKVLDFGLATALAPFFDAAASPVVETHTLPGALLGTPAYMSPEQARGEAASRHADNWAFGVVLFELLSGVSPFARSTTAETLASVLGEQPDYSRLPPDTPAGVRRLIRRCLEKDRKRRLQHIGDARIEIEDAIADPANGTGDGRRTSGDGARSSRWLAAAAVLGLLTSVVLAALVYKGRRDSAAPTVRFSVLPPDRGMFQTPIIAGSGATVGGTISPDGRTVAFTASDASGKILLWVRPLDVVTARALPGTDDAALPFWSPDGRSLGFFSPGKLKRVDVADGTVQDLCDVSRGRGGAWNGSDVIVFAPGLGTGLQRIAASGGEPRVLTTLRDNERSHRFPFFLPDGRRFLYYVEGSDANSGGVFAGSLDGGAAGRVMAADSAAIYAGSGHLLFVRQGTLFARRFDAATLQLEGDAVAIAEPISTEGASPAFSVSNAGVLTYRSGVAHHQQFGWFDRRTGGLIEAVGQPGPYRGVDLAADGTRIAVHRHDGNGGDIWVLEPRGATTRVTFDAAQDNSGPTWSPDGKRLAFASLRNGRWGLYHKSADATESDALLLESDVAVSPVSWSPDGKYIVYARFATKGGPSQWLLPLAGGGRQTRPLTQSRFYESHSQISPDGKWVAYAANTTGRLEVYVRPFPSGDGVFQVSTAGGVTPRWRSDGKELFYATSYDRGRLMAVELAIEGARLVPGVTQELFDMGPVTPPHSTTIPSYHTYAVSPDGERFLTARPTGRLGSDGAEAPITVVLNWTAMVDR